MPVCGNYLFFELPKKIVLNPKDGKISLHVFHAFPCIFFLFVLEWFYRNSYYLEWIHSPQHL